jgi:hypothetical protein
VSLGDSRQILQGLTLHCGYGRLGAAASGSWMAEESGRAAPSRLRRILKDGTPAGPATPTAEITPGQARPVPAGPFSVPASWVECDLATIADWSCPPLVPLVDGLVARGNLVILSGESQTGKSLFALYLTLHLLHGGALFGRYAVHPVPTVLYLVLEDPQRRVKDRLDDMREAFPAVEPGRCTFLVAPSFSLGDDPMKGWLADRIRRTQPAVLILDTYQKATPGLDSYNDAQQSGILHWLANLTRETGVTIIVLDHVRKQQAGRGAGRRTERRLSFDDIKGTGGKMQNADCVILMGRAASRTEIHVQALAKDFEQPVQIVVRVGTRGSREPKFQYVRDLTTSPAENKTRMKVLATLSAVAWQPASVVAEKADLNLKTVQGWLKDLVAAGLAEDNGAGTRGRAYRRKAQSIQSAADPELVEYPESEVIH